MQETIIDSVDIKDISDRRQSSKIYNDLWAALLFISVFLLSVVLAIIGIVKIGQADIWTYGLPIELTSLKATASIPFVFSILIGIVLPVIIFGAILRTQMMRTGIVLSVLTCIIGGIYAFFGLNYVGVKSVFMSTKEYYTESGRAVETIYTDQARVAFAISLIIILVLNIVAFIMASKPRETLVLNATSKMLQSYPAFVIQITSVALLSQLLVFMILVLPLWGYFLVDTKALFVGTYERGPYFALFVFQLICLYWYSEIIRNMVHVKLSNLFVDNILQRTSDPRLIQRRFGSICHASLRFDVHNSVKRSLILVAASEKSYAESSQESDVLAIKEQQRRIKKDPKLSQKTFSDRLPLYTWAIMLAIGFSVFGCHNFFSGFSVDGTPYGLMFLPYGISWTFMTGILAMMQFNLIIQILKSGSNSLQICSEIDRSSYKKYLSRVTDESDQKSPPMEKV